MKIKESISDNKFTKLTDDIPIGYVGECVSISLQAQIDIFPNKQ